MCERFSVDPAYMVQDDFLAHQMRVALCIAHPFEEPEETQEREAEAGYQENAMRRQELEMRAMMRG